MITTKELFALASIAALALVPMPAAAKDKVKVSFIGPLTGGTAANGIGGRNSAELAVKLRNADPKAKYEYELVVLDDECKPNVAVQVATKAAADRNIVASVSHYCSVAAIAAVETYNRLGLPMVVWGAVLPDITYRNKFPEVHRVNGTMINQNEVAAKLMTSLGFKRWVSIHDTTDYGKAHNQYFSQYAKANGGEIVGTYGVTADQQDFTAELTQSKALNPQVIYFGGLTPIGIRLRSQMDRLGVNAVFQGTSGIKSDAYIQGLGPLAEGLAELPRGRADREAARRQVFPGGVRQGRLQGAAGGLRRVRFCRHEARPRPDRGGRSGPQEDHGGSAQDRELRLHRRPRDVRRSRPEHRPAHFEIRRPGRQMGDLGGQRVRRRQAQACEVTNVGTERPRPGRVQRGAWPSGTRPGTQQEKREAQYHFGPVRRVALGPGSSLAPQPGRSLGRDTTLN